MAKKISVKEGVTGFLLGIVAIGSFFIGRLINPEDTSVFNGHENNNPNPAATSNTAPKSKKADAVLTDTSKVIPAVNNAKAVGKGQ